ncbi:MAG: glycosyltransferase family 10 [Litorimonas sp.]
MRVKFLAKTSPNQDPALWTSLFPNGTTTINGTEFVFDINAREYDWLVVYQGLPPHHGEKKINRIEPLACAQQNTLLITTEPSSIRIDGPQFMAQFGHVLTSKAPELVRHAGHIKRTPPLRWFYGRPMGDNGGEYTTYEDLLAQAPLSKTKDISTVCSTKQMSHTVHAKRYEFVMALRERMEDLDVFGRGINPINEKSEAMNDYRYHVAIENHIEAGHWTEKLADSFLAYCLPLYFGDPDYASIFPEQAVIPINIYDIDAAERTIRKAIADNEYEKRLPFIKKARQIILKNYNLVTSIEQFISSQTLHTSPQTPSFIYGRHIFRKKFPLRGISDAVFRIKMRKHPNASPLQF